ncbi:ABC-F family ATP-binding cassette domain-containing protein [Fictibacillus sp. S7]|uniref:ABC-F family ATP-binding cassette domain-containing protein n=1 Tax=Fictibacillus sp. S7 TaxID=2212476 RepID=UPI001010B7DC|nr:ABC-F family ATP-binding cassette domain-containing protein [Fictibacillus sp. S7]RXZ00440.1 ABC transporter [Fictibacillus sp. S7]
MSLLSVEQLSKSYGDKTLFQDISFTISEKQRIGIIGVNGTGKSTLLKIIAGLESADTGEIIHANDFHIEYLSQTPYFEEGVTVLEAVFYGNSPLMQLLREYERAISSLEADPQNEKLQNKLFSLQQKMDAMDAWDTNTTAKTVLNRLGITMLEQQVSMLSGGQQKRVAIARALIQPADLLILDEPTNHIDNETVEWLEDFLAKYRGALLMVTHDRYFLNRVTNRMIELEAGNLYTYEGNYEMFLDKKAEREEREASSEQKRQNLLRRELAWLRRGAKARTTKQKARVQRAEALKEQSGPAQKGQMEVAIGSARLGKKVIEIEEISKSFNGKVLFRDFSYLVMPDDRLGIIGKNGSGKTTLLNILAGKMTPDTGQVETGPTVKLGFYTQNHEEMDENLRVIEYIREAAEVIYTKDGQPITASQMLERFLFSPSAQWTYISRLSGGERRRLYLLRVLMDEPNVLFLDEPTNDLDIETLSVLEDYLEHFPGAVITVSHDRYFLDRTMEHLFALEGNGSVERFDGDYSEYLEQKRKDEEQIAASKTAASPEDWKPKKEKARRLSYKEQKEWETIEDTIAELEEKHQEIESQIAAAGSDFGKIDGLFREQQEVAARLEAAMNRWEELSVLVEEIEKNK